MFKLLICVLCPVLLLNANPVKVPVEVYKKTPNLRSHPGFYPFIGYLTFRNICDHIIDQSTEWFDPYVVKQGDTIFLNVHYLPWFTENVHDQIPYPYILVTSEYNVAWMPTTFMKNLLYDPKLAGWFCINLIFSYHPKLFQLPMGQFFSHPDPEEIEDLADVIAKKPYPKKHWLYMNFYPRPDGDREKIMQHYQNKPFCFTRIHSNMPWNATPRPVFFEEMAFSYFTLSPIGLETDCMRTWEAFVLDCIPIVEHTFLDPLYEGLPIVFVHDFFNIDKPFLEKKYAELKTQKFQMERAYFDYWHQRIRKIQHQVRNKELAFADLEATLFSEADLQELIQILKQHEMAQDTLFYKGFLSTLRPFQLANSTGLQKIYLQDPWLDRAALETFSEYLKDKSYLKNKDKIFPLSSEGQFQQKLDAHHPAAVFLDLTYYRASLKFDTSKRIDQFFRHSLLRDLTELYEQLPSHSSLIGNMSCDQYVREVLDRFAKDHSVTIEKSGSFWYIKKAI